MARVASQIPLRINNVPSLASDTERIEYLVREVNRVLTYVSTSLARLSGELGGRIELRSSLDLDGNELFNIGAPTTDKSATNKEFVEDLLATIRETIGNLNEEVRAAGSLSGTGTENVVSKFTAPSVLEDSTITDTGTEVRTTADVGIGISVTPAATLEVTKAGSGDTVLRNTTEGVGQRANLYFATGSAGAALTDLNVIAHIAAAITQADPSVLIGKMDIRINGGDNTNPIITITGEGNLGLLQATFGTSSSRVFAISNGTAPASSPANATQLYSADQAAGNACLHIRTENGSVVKLYQESALTAEDATVIDATYDATEEAVLNNVRTRVGEIETALQNLGILA